MPRDGSGIFANIPGTEGVPDTTIESAKYNAYIADIEFDLNAPRPIGAGGTGSTSTSGALDTLGAEVARVVVTDYNAHAWSSGSFYSAVGAAGAPNSTSAFQGIVIATRTPEVIIVQAREVVDGIDTPGLEYTRQKKAGAWGVWVDTRSSLVSMSAEVAHQVVADFNTHPWQSGSFFAPATALNSPWAGHRFQGIVTVTTVPSEFIFIEATEIEFADSNVYVRGKRGGIWTPWHWDHQEFHDQIEYHGLNKLDKQSVDPLAFIKTNASDTVSLISSKLLTTTLWDIWLSAATSNDFVMVRNYPVGSPTNCFSLSYLTGKASFSGDIIFGTSSAQPILNFGPATNFNYIQADNARNMQYVCPTTSPTASHYFTPGSSGNVYKPGGGSFANSPSDARVKNVHGAYEHGLEQILQITPRRYSYKGNDALVAGGKSLNEASVATGRQFIGLIAQEVEAAMPELVTQQAGYIDGKAVADLRSLDSSALVFALVNAVKTLAARVAALEAP